MPDLQFRKCLMLPPHVLQKKKVPVYRAVQRTNQIVITFPRGYHGGFSHGFNYAESSNFALPTWLEYGSRSAELYRQASLDVKAKSKHSEGRNTVIGIDTLLWTICVDQLGASGDMRGSAGKSCFSSSVTSVARQQLARRLRRELIDRKRMKDHKEPAKVVVDNTPEEEEEEKEVKTDLSDVSDASASPGADGDEVVAQGEGEHVVEGVISSRVAKGGKGREYEVKWKGYPSGENSWEPEANLQGNAQLKAFKDRTGKGKGKTEAAAEKKKLSQKRKKLEAPAAAASGKKAAAGAGGEGPLQCMVLKALEKDGVDWDLREEPCHLCHHPCFFTLIKSSHPDAFHPTATEDDDGENYQSQMKGGSVAAAAPMETGEAPIPLVSCLSPCCLMKLPGTLEQLEMLTFYDDGALRKVLRECEKEGAGNGNEEQPLPSFHGEMALRINPVKNKVFVSRAKTMMI